MEITRFARRKTWMIGLSVFMLTASGVSVLAISHQTFYAKSLHYTGEGMRYCYEREDGLMSITKIPYKELDCKNCHVQTCDACHAEQKGNKFLYTNAKAERV